MPHTPEISDEEIEKEAVKDPRYIRLVSYIAMLRHQKRKQMTAWDARIADPVMRVKNIRDIIELRLTRNKLLGAGTFTIKPGTRITPHEIAKGPPERSVEGSNADAVRTEDNQHANKG